MKKINNSKNTINHYRSSTFENLYSKKTTSTKSNLQKSILAMTVSSILIIVSVYMLKEIIFSFKGEHSLLLITTMVFSLQVFLFYHFSGILFNNLIKIKVLSNIDKIHNQ